MQGAYSFLRIFGLLRKFQMLVVLSVFILTSGAAENLTLLAQFFFSISLHLQKKNMFVVLLDCYG